jgi:hypothetical protein
VVSLVIGSHGRGRLSRLLFLLALSFGTIVGPGTAWAEDEEEDDGDDGGGDGGDGGADPDDPDGGEEPEDPKEQPAVTSGGLFTIKTYPVNELQRPLTMTQGITQLRLGLGSDLSAKTAFEFFGVSLDGEYGLKDNFTLIGGFAGDYNFKGFNISAGFEGALAYDLFDIRLQARIYRAAIVSDLDDGAPAFVGGEDMSAVEGRTGVPTNFAAGAGTQFSIDLGFPFRYAATPQIAIVALETLVSIDFNGITRGNGKGDPNINLESCFAVPDGMKTVDNNNCTEDGAKPDLAPSLGIASNPIPQLSLVLFAQLQIRDFDTTNQFTIPATARIQFSPNQKFDIGLEFKFLNMKPLDPDGEGPAEAPSPIDQRFMNMFMQARY